MVDYSALRIVGRVICTSIYILVTSQILRVLQLGVGLDTNAVVYDIRDASETALLALEQLRGTSATQAGQEALGTQLATIEALLKGIVPARTASSSSSATDTMLARLLAEFQVRLIVLFAELTLLYPANVLYLLYCFLQSATARYDRSPASAIPPEFAGVLERISSAMEKQVRWLARQARDPVELSVRSTACAFIGLFQAAVLLALESKVDSVATKVDRAPVGTGGADSKASAIACPLITVANFGESFPLALVLEAASSDGLRERDKSNKSVRGTGSFGTVIDAVLFGGTVPVVVKVLKNSAFILGNPKLLARVEAEASHQYALRSHPNIVTVYGLLRDDARGILGIVMERCDAALDTVLYGKGSESLRISMETKFLMMQQVR